ncbi:MAG: hypothetical protein ABSB59_28335 [Streptosporangiaceae bacterium]|jgi:hypothetical protein
MSGIPVGSRLTVGGLDPHDAVVAYFRALYVIRHDGPGAWSAERRDGAGTVRAASAPRILAAMAADHGAQPVRLPPA